MESVPEVNEDYPAIPKLRHVPERKPLSPTLARGIEAIPIREPITQPEREVVYVEVPVEKVVERIVEKPVEKVVERIIEKPVYIQQPAPPPEPVPEKVPVTAEPITEKRYIYIPPEQRTESEIQPDRTAPPVEVKTDLQPKKEPEPEVKSEVQPPGQLEEKTSGGKVQKEPESAANTPQPEITKVAQPEHKDEEKASKPEEKASGTVTKKLKVYNGSGRRHTAAEIDEILDGYILYGELPEYVSERQRSSYRHHVKLPERRQLLEQAGFIKTASRTKKRTSNVVPMAGTQAHSKRRASSSV